LLYHKRYPHACAAEFDGDETGKERGSVDGCTSHLVAYAGLRNAVSYAFPDVAGYSEVDDGKEQLDGV